MNSLYCTTSGTRAGTGAGIVSHNEIEALKEVSNVKLVLSHNEIEPRKYGLPNNPFLYDYLAASLIHEPVDIAHLYSDPFGMTCDKLHTLNPDTLIVATCDAHNLETSVEEFNRLGFEYPFKHMTDPFLWALYSKHLKDANVVICPSKTGADYLKRKVEIKNVVVIPHGVDIPAQEKITPLPDKFAAAYLGQVGPDKGLIYLLKAWSSLNYPDAELTLAGIAGSEQTAPAIRQIVTDGIFDLIGYVPDVSTVYNRCSVYVQPSITEGWGIEVLEAMSCFPKGQLIFTKEGLKDISKVNRGDYVIGKDGRWQKVLSKRYRFYKGKVIKVRPRGLPEMTMTARHPVYVAKIAKVYDGKRNEERRYPYKRVPESMKWVYASSLTTHHFLNVPKVQIGENKIYDQKYMELLGWYVAEGYSEKLKSRGHRVNFSLNKNEAEYVSNLIFEVVGKEPNVTEDKNNPNCLRVSFYSKEWMNNLENWCGIGARYKKIPPFVFDADSASKIAFLMGYIAGDGHVRLKGVEMKTASKELAYELIFLLNSLGIKTGWTETLRDEITIVVNNKAHVHDFYSVSTFGRGAEKLGFPSKKNHHDVVVETVNAFWTPVIHISQSYYQGYVYNISTEDSTYTAPFVLVHNCGRPVITTNGCGASDAITDGEDGFVVPPRDSHAIAMKIDYLKNNPGELKRLAENARIKAKEYDWNKIRESYKNIYSKLLGGEK